jgi:hypothetical protein
MKPHANHSGRTTRSHQKWTRNLPDNETFGLGFPSPTGLVFEGQAYIKDQLGTPIRNYSLHTACRRIVFQYPIAPDESADRAVWSDLLVFHGRITLGMGHPQNLEALTRVLRKGRPPTNSENVLNLAKIAARSALHKGKSESLSKALSDLRSHRFDPKTKTPTRSAMNRAWRWTSVPLASVMVYVPDGKYAWAISIAAAPAAWLLEASV